MKRFCCLFLCVILIFAFTGCNSDKLQSGYYFLVCDREEGVTPYVKLNFEDNSFAFGEGLLLSYAEHGTFVIIGSRMIATTQNTTFSFEIQDSTSIILRGYDQYEAFEEYEGSEFRFNPDW